jgi:hypothetical protein
MDRKSFYMSLIILVILILGAARIVAQEPEEESQSSKENISITALVNSNISYQGVLKENGNLVTGNRNMVFQFYSNNGCTTQVQEISQGNVPISAGVFSVNLTVNPIHFNGQGLWLRVVVSGATIVSCQEIVAVPYALSLRPGAEVIGASPDDSTIYASNTATTGNFSYGVYGVSNSSTGRGVNGEATADSGTARGVSGISRSTEGRGVNGFATATSGVNYGVYGQSFSSSGYGGFFYNNNGGKALGVQSSSSSTGTHLIEAMSASGDIEFYVTANGNVAIDGTLSTNNGDFAEMLPAVEGLEPGDVLAVDQEGNLTRSLQPHQTSVVGVYSTQPGFLGGAAEGLTDQVPLAMIGRVPVKASAENGPIEPGDLLVASATPGHAMKASADPPLGSVIGKALAGLEEGTGVIQMLVMLQ